MDRHPSRQSQHVVTRVSQLIGNTPMLQLLSTRFGSRILLKLEQCNPTGSAKIRMARQMLDEAEQQGLLRPGGWVIESTSGNTGMGLALLAAERGYRFTAVVDHHAAKDKIRAMQAYGAELIYVNEHGGDALATADREALAESLATGHGAYWTEQHNNPANGNAYSHVAQELLDTLGEDLTHLVGAVGTGGSLFGTARVLKPRLPRLRVIGVEPEGSIAFGGPGGPYYQSGTGTPPGAAIGSLVDYDALDEGLKVSDRQAFNTARYLARRYALLVGGSAGGVLYQAIRRIGSAPPGSTFVVLICDGGEKYLDTVFNDDWMRERDLLDPAVGEELEQLIEQLSEQSMEQP
ncbi:cysteine synthase family protein [Noviherbaspirillum aridicola]|uniref:Cysteine synthase n=1 Tax=Noviherbaspirillum aridicola TaxID=2849687 RepID=A0ABQ4Q5A5_9BURK|nr:cysteine synthase family protein [Noviherbaspirillum aridicola]GIZ51980.1 putative cysteine synthase [Noviherbaspirillum aridicola]